MSIIQLDENGRIAIPVETSFAELSNYLKSAMHSGNEEPVAILMSELGEYMRVDEMDEKPFVEEFIHNLDNNSNDRVIDLVVKYKYIDSAHPTTEKDVIEAWLPLHFV